MAMRSKFLVVQSMFFAAVLIGGVSFSLQGAEAGAFSWFKDIWPQQPSPEDPHLYPEESLLYQVWTCKGETDMGWIGVTQQFTDQDPDVVVVVRSEFPEQNQMHLQVGVELIGPRNGMIIASDRVNLVRDQDVAFFYHPLDMARLGGWGEYTIVIMIDGMPTDEQTFRLDRQEDLDKKREEDRLRKEAESAFKGESLEARSLLGTPDSGPEAKTGESAADTEKPVLSESQSQQIEVRDPRDWSRREFENPEDKIVLFPKKARQAWQENVKKDLRHRIKYYIFL
jgi:hypothetical protein